MPRDVLIILLVFGLLANVALIAGVAWVNHRTAGRPRTTGPGDPGAPVAADDLDIARLLARGPDARSIDGTDAPPDEAPPPEPQPVTVARPAPTQLADPAPRPRARRTPRAGSSPPSGGDGATAAVGTTERRGRRFVLPDDDGSHARTDRAIAAFLGEPVAPDPDARGSRRRHRARRPAGAPVPRTDLVMSLAGSTPDPRLVHALSAALRGAVRSSDQVVELPRGRLRITLETDVSGGEAFVRRARGVVKPWLSALDPDLELRVERPRTRQSVASPS